MSFVDVGYYNFVDVNKIISVGSVDSSPTKRVIDLAKKEGRYINFAKGRRTNSIVLSQCGDNVIVTGSSLVTNTLVKRIRNSKK